MNMKRNLPKGMSLPEVLVAVALLSMMVFSIAGAITLTFKASRADKDITEAIAFSQQTIEAVRASVEDASSFVALNSRSFEFLDNTDKLVYDITVIDIETDNLKRVTVRVFYQDETSSTPQPVGDRIFQISTFIARP